MIKPNPEEMATLRRSPEVRLETKASLGEEPLISLVAYFSKSLLHYSEHCGHKGHNTNKAQAAFSYCFWSDLNPCWHYKAWSWGLWPVSHWCPYAGTWVCALTQRGLLTQTNINTVKEAGQERIILHGLDACAVVLAKRSNVNILPKWGERGKGRMGWKISLGCSHI